MSIEQEIRQEKLLRAVLTELQRMNGTLDVVAEALVNGAGQNQNAGPNFQRALKEYPTFDWDAIGAEVVKRDQHGATVVKWYRAEYIRRRHADYDASIWFSRYTGQKDENDHKIYDRLITFNDRPRIVKSLPEEVSELLPASSPIEPSSPEQPPSKATVSSPQEPPTKPPSRSLERSEKLPTAAGAAADPRAQFYQLLPQLIHAGKIEAELANQLTNLAREKGYAAALATAQQIAAGDDAQDNTKSRSLASDPQDNTQSSGSERSSEPPTAAHSAAASTYPKNELDEFFPRE